MRFIKINGIYYDYEKYRKIIFDLENAIAEELELCIAKFGFKKNNVVLYNKELDLILELSIKTKSTLEFV